GQISAAAQIFSRRGRSEPGLDLCLWWPPRRRTPRADSYPYPAIPDMATTRSLPFPERLAKSQLLDAEQLAAARQAAGDDEKALCNHLLERGLLTRFQVRQLRSGATYFSVGKYVVVDCLGRGASGIVLKARHRLMGNRYVALKTVDERNLHRDGQAVARFR